MTEKLRQLQPLGLALAGVFAVLSFIYGVDHRFFFLNDRQMQYFPYGLVIRDALLRGEMPFVTTRTFFGGALWLDPQYGLYNPLSLLLDFLINPQALAFSGYLISMILNLLLATAVYMLGRTYGLARGNAALLGLMMGINVLVLNLYSNMWQPGLVSLIWSVFAWASLKHLPGSKGRVAGHVLVAALLIFFTVSGGWPHQYVALAAVMAVLFVEAWREENRPGMFRLAYAGALGGVFSLIVLAPMAAASGFWSRNTSFYNNGVHSPDLGDLLNFSNPGWLPHYQHFYMSFAPAPLFFAGWFALPLLLALPFRRFERIDFRGRGELLALLGIFMLLVLSAQEMGPLRWPIRWLVDAHLSFLLLLLLSLESLKPGEIAFRPFLALAALLVTTLAAFLENPAQMAPTAALVLLPVLFIPMTPAAGRRMGLPLFLGITSVLMAMAIGVAFSGTHAFLDHGKRSQPEVSSPAEDASPGYDLFWGLKKNTADLPDERQFLEGAMGAYYGINTINGYSSLFYGGLDRVFPGTEKFPDFSSVERLQLALHEPETGASYLDLLKIRKISSAAALAPRELPDGQWRRAESRGAFLFGQGAGRGLAFGEDRIVTFVRKSPFNLPGTVSWHSPSISLAAPVKTTSYGERLDIVNHGGSGIIVFARLYYPGFTACLEGMPLKTRALDHLLVAVEVPAQAKGRLYLHFTPPLLSVSLILAALALGIWAVAAVVEAKTESGYKRSQSRRT